MNISSLLTKATNDKLTKGELQFVADVAALRNHDSYKATLILGRSYATAYRNILESLLQSPSDPMLARGAVYALCQCWDETEKFLPELIAFCQGVAWDEENDVRLISLSCGGEYLRKNWNQELAGVLAKVAENESDEIVRNSARTAIARAMGLDHSQIPPPLRLLKGSPLEIDDAMKGFMHRIVANYA